jgi:hypothetical protein
MFQRRPSSEMLNTYSGWPGLAQVYHLQRDFQWSHNGACYRTSSEVEFGITSLTRQEALPRQLLHIRRSHQGIATGLLINPFPDHEKAMGLHGYARFS